MKLIGTIARVLLGLIFFVFGLNGFLNFLPMPEGIPEGAMAFSMAMMKTGYFMPMLKGIEVVSGAMLLANVYVPLVLLVLAPIALNIFLFHWFLTPGIQNVTIPLVIIGLGLTLAWAHRAIFKPFFKRAFWRFSRGPSETTSNSIIKTKLYSRNILRINFNFLF